jgi:hypothetical protein
LQVPVAEYVRSVDALRQTLAGGELQLTPAQGLPLHIPALQPLAQLMSVEA